MSMMKFFLPILALAAILLAGCSSPSAEEAMRQALADANFCEEESDCALLTGVCPFDCWVMVNESQSGAIAAQLAAYETDCTYSCMPAPDYECRAGKCEFVR